MFVGVAVFKKNVYLQMSRVLCKIKKTYFNILWLCEQLQIQTTYTQNAQPAKKYETGDIFRKIGLEIEE